MNPALSTKLRHLRLSGVAEALPARLAQAEAASMSFVEFLELLVEAELHRRADRLFARRVKQACITAIKELKDKKDDQDDEQSQQDAGKQGKVVPDPLHQGLHRRGGRDRRGSRRLDHRGGRCWR